MSDKEILICLVIGFVNSLKLIDQDSDDDEQDGLNDELNRISLAIEDMTVKVFGRKINMDFGMLHAIHDNPATIIQAIEDYNENER